MYKAEHSVFLHFHLTPPEIGFHVVHWKITPGSRPAHGFSCSALVFRFDPLSVHAPLVFWPITRREAKKKTQGWKAYMYPCYFTALCPFIENRWRGESRHIVGQFKGKEQGQRSSGRVFCRRFYPPIKLSCRISHFTAFAARTSEASGRCRTCRHFEIGQCTPTVTPLF